MCSLSNDGKSGLLRKGNADLFFYERIGKVEEIATIIYRQFVFDIILCNLKCELLS